MMRFPARVIPVELFPGDWCLNCVDPDHSGRTCHMLEMHHMPDGHVEVKTCGCDTSITAGEPGKYLVRVTQVQHD